MMNEKMDVLTIVSCIFAMLSVMGVIWARSLAELWVKDSTEYTSTGITILCAVQLGLLAIMFVVEKNNAILTVGVYSILAMSAGVGLAWTRDLHIAWDEDQITHRFVPMFGVQLAAACCVLYGQLLWNY